MRRVYPLSIKQKTTVISLKNWGEYCVYVGRPDKWGNPFKMGHDRLNGRPLVIIQYFNHLRSNTKLKKELTELQGKTLACHCKPKDCHGDVLAAFADSLHLLGDDWPPMELHYQAKERPTPVWLCFVGQGEEVQFKFDTSLYDTITGAIELWASKRGTDEPEKSTG
jgi:hypothetical protein